MRLRLPGLLLSLVLLASGCLCGNGGTVCAVIIASSSFDYALRDRSWWAWIADPYSRMLVDAPAFDADRSWYRRGWSANDVDLGSPRWPGHHG